MTGILNAMIAYEGKNVPRVNHFLKVLGYARAIAEGESLCGETLRILETAAILHDVGIGVSLEKYGSAAGPYQEKEGPPIAREMLTSLGYDAALTERVCYLVGHHHSYDAIDGVDYQILVEADFLVNIFEGGMAQEKVEEVKRNIFKTATGTKLLQGLFL